MLELLAIPRNLSLHTADFILYAPLIVDSVRLVLAELFLHSGSITGITQVSPETKTRLTIGTSYIHSPSNGPIHLSQHHNVYYQPLLSVSLPILTSYTYHVQPSHELSFFFRTLHALVNIRIIYPIYFSVGQDPEICLPGSRRCVSIRSIKCLADDRGPPPQRSFAKDHRSSTPCGAREKHHAYGSLNSGVFIDAKRAAYGRVGKSKTLHEEHSDRESDN